MSRFLAVFALILTTNVASAQDLDARIAARLENRVSKVEKELAELKAEFHKLKTPTEVAPAPKSVSQDKKAVPQILVTTTGHRIEQQPDGTYRYLSSPGVFQPQYRTATPIYQFGSPCANGRCPR